MAKANQVSRKALDREINNRKRFNVSKNVSVKTFMIGNDPLLFPLYSTVRMNAGLNSVTNYYCELYACAMNESYFLALDKNKVTDKKISWLGS